MEFRTTIRDLARYRIIFIVFVIIVTGASYWLSVAQQPKYVTSLSIAVNRIHRQETAQYQYDGYYAIQASDLFSQTILSWFLTPSVLLEVYERANVDPQISSLSALVGRFRARKLSPQNLVVQFTDPNKADAQKIADSIAAVMKKRGSAINQNDQGEPIFEALPALPVIVESKPNVVVNTLAGFAASVIAGIVLLAFVRYLRN